jgi:FtsZ-binding cell division protein ZapB
LEEKDREVEAIREEHRRVLEEKEKELSSLRSVQKETEERIKALLEKIKEAVME